MSLSRASLQGDFVNFFVSSAVASAAIFASFALATATLAATIRGYVAALVLISGAKTTSRAVPSLPVVYACDFEFSVDSFEDLSFDVFEGVGGGAIASMALIDALRISRYPSTILPSLKPSHPIPLKALLTAGIWTNIAREGSKSTG